MMLQLKIDPEFRSKIPPLTEAEFKQLEANILDAGKVYEPIAIWNNTIVDGHNRYKIAMDHPEIEWTVREMTFTDKWAAFDWMYKNQLGRRNLTEQQRTYILGKLYEARKHTQGGSRGNQYTKLATAEKRLLPKNTDGVSIIIAKEQNVGKTHVKDSYQYAKGIDAIREEEPELADSILKSEKKVLKKDIQTIGRADPERKKELIKKVKTGLPIPSEKENLTEYENVAESLSDEHVMEFSASDLAAQIRINAEMFVRTLSNLLMDHSNLCNENPLFIVRTIDECLINQIDKIKERLSNGTQL